MNEFSWKGKLVDWLVTAIPGKSSRTLCSAGPVSEEPFLKRGLAFTGGPAREEAFYADVPIKLLPMNPMPLDHKKKGQAE